MSYELSIILAFSVLIPAILAIFKYSSSTSEYHPFFFLIWIGLINEVISVWLNYAGYPNAINSNIYVLIESLIILWQFRKWKLFTAFNLFYPFVFLYLAVWVTENFFISRISYFNSYFGILYSFVTVLMSVQVVNQLIVREQKSISRHPAFIISIGFIIFYTYRALVEIFWIYGLNNSAEFQTDVYSILHVINFICNLIYALAISWIRKQFIRPSF